MNMLQGKTVRRNLIRIGFGTGLLTLTPGRLRNAAAQTPEAMSLTRTEEVMAGYVDALLNGGDFAAYFADNIVVSMVDVGQDIVGREAAEQAIIDLHMVTFAAAPEVQTFVVGPGIASAEIVFVGTHTGEFAGIPASGQAVSVPYAVFWELADEKITGLRLYGLASGLIRQLTSAPAPANGTPAA
jgi:predicted ester cyclase